MKKIIFLALAALLLVCASAGCIAEEDKEFYPNGVRIYIDEESGVEYLVVLGNGLKYVGIAPRYNADGTLKINEEFK
jgi:hypothetical protein